MATGARASGGRGLRRGWTTGACAAAAAGAAYTALATGRFPDPARVTLPGGERPSFPLALAECDGRFARVAVRKDAGDDPDVTHGALVEAWVRRAPTGAGIVFRGGEGIGTVTRPGLGLPVGEPAINPAPRRMIGETLRELAHALNGPPDVAVAIAIGAGLRGGGRAPTTAHVGGLGPVLREVAEETRIGIAFVRRRRLFVAVLLVAFAFNLILNGFNAAFPEIAERDLGVRELLIGVFYAVLGAGSVIGGLAIARWSSWSRAARLYWAGGLAFALGAMAAAFAPAYAAAAALAFAMGLGYACVFVMQTSLLAAYSPEILRGRVMGVLSAVIGTGPLTGLQIGLFAGLLGPRWGVAVLSIEAIVLLIATAAAVPAIVSKLGAAPAPPRGGRA